MPLQPSGLDDPPQELPGAGDGHPLLLATRQLVGPGTRAVAQAHSLEHLEPAVLGLVGRDPVDLALEKSTAVARAAVFAVLVVSVAGLPDAAAALMGRSSRRLDMARSSRSWTAVRGRSPGPR